MALYATADDAASSLLEQRWFACMAAVRTLTAECEALQLLATQSTDACLRAYEELSRLECLRDALGKAMAEREGTWDPAPAPAGRRMAPAA